MTDYPRASSSVAANAAEVIAAQAAEIDRLREDCAEAYQVVGSLAGSAGLFNDPATQKALDNLLAAADAKARPHSDLLPFVSGQRERG